MAQPSLGAARYRAALLLLGPESADGNGLMLRIRNSGSRQCVQRLTVHGRSVGLELGSAELVKLADACKVTADNRAIARTGGDPRRSRVPTFEKAETVCFAEKRVVWRADGPAKNWRSPMDRYVLPKLGAMPVDKVGSAVVHEVHEVLRPITAIHDPTPASIRCRERHRRHRVNALTRVLRWRCGPGE